MNRGDRIITGEAAHVMMKRACSHKEYAPSDIARKLERMDFSVEVTDKIIDRLKKEGYINEKRYIRSFIHDKLLFNKWGKKKIALSLIRKQLPRELIDEAFLELPDDSFGKSLLPLLEKKWKTIKGRSEFERRGKLIGFALGKGFSMNEVMDCLEIMHINENDDASE